MEHLLNPFARAQAPAWEFGIRSSGFAYLWKQELPRQDFQAEAFIVIHKSVIPSIGIYTTLPHNKNNELRKRQAPSPVGEGWDDENKIKHLHSPHPSLLPLNKEQQDLCRYLCIPAGIHVRLSCLTPFGLMQICSRQICAGQIGRTADLH
jgi:hypothetical protein